jgi:REP element-mobilizing transposase RayT
LKEQHYKDCEDAIRNAAKRHGIELLELGVMPDHVHIVAILPVGMAPGKAVGLLKGYSTH